MMHSTTVVKITRIIKVKDGNKFLKNPDPIEWTSIKARAKTFHSQRQADRLLVNSGLKYTAEVKLTFMPV